MLKAGRRQHPVRAMIRGATYLSRRFNKMERRLLEWSIITYDGRDGAVGESGVLLICSCSGGASSVGSRKRAAQQRSPGDTAATGGGFSRASADIRVTDAGDRHMLRVMVGGSDGHGSGPGIVGPRRNVVGRSPGQPSHLGPKRARPLFPGTPVVTCSRRAA
jgi:hypothetical protein